jgi:hypothetical protein
MSNFLDGVKEQIQSNIAIDFDGVIHKGSKGFYDGTIYDEPVEGAKEALAELSKKYKLIIFTCKAKPGRPLVNGKTGEELIWEWLKKYDMDQYISYITAEKPRVLYYIEDKAIKFISWKQVMGEL